MSASTSAKTSRADRAARPMRERGKLPRRAGSTPPFTCRIEGAGIHVDVRVEDGESIRAVANAVSEGIARSLESVPLDGRPQPNDLLSGILSGEWQISDAELDRVLDLLGKERSRRAEMRS